MKRIIAINCSPRTAWNTAALVREAAKGAEAQGAEVTVIDLYKLEKFTGCVSCFGCKLPEHLGKCICNDGLAPVLEAYSIACRTEYMEIPIGWNIKSQKSRSA